MEQFYFSLREWPQVGGFTAELVEESNGIGIYSLTFSYETITATRKQNGVVQSIKKYLHIATHGGFVFLYDLGRQEFGGRLGTYDLYRVDENYNLQPVA
ncbi:MAG: hypothetical protein IPH35_04835 [Rhodoferax sp.]|nr:hypothetical protein [Rhodoferax sp.]